jgi:hypothetical protein
MKLICSLKILVKIRLYLEIIINRDVSFQHILLFFSDDENDIIIIENKSNLQYH